MRRSLAALEGSMGDVAGSGHGESVRIMAGQVRGGGIGAPPPPHDSATEMRYRGRVRGIGASVITLAPPTPRLFPHIRAVHTYVTIVEAGTTLVQGVGLVLSPHWRGEH